MPRTGTKKAEHQPALHPWRVAPVGEAMSVARASAAHTGYSFNLGVQQVNGRDVDYSSEMDLHVGGARGFRIVSVLE